MSSSFLKFCHSFDKLVTRLRVAQFYMLSYSSYTNKSDYHDFVNNSYDYRPNWTPLSPITIINQMRVIHIKSTIKAQEALNTGVESVKQSALVNGGIVMEEWKKRGRSGTGRVKNERHNPDLPPILASFYQ